MPDTVPPEVDTVVARVRNLNDRMQLHAEKIVEFTVRIEDMQRELTALHDSKASREELRAAVDRVASSLTSAVSDITLRFSHVTDDLDPIKKGIYWLVTLLIGAIVLAGLNLILKKP